MQNAQSPTPQPKKENVIATKSLDFAVRIVNLHKHLCTKSIDRHIPRQLLKSGTSVGANVREGLRAQTQEDFIAKMNIALKEAEESEYWLELLHRTQLLTDKEMESIFPECNVLTRLLTSIVKTAKSNLQKK